MSVAERARLAAFRVPKRRADWLAGRFVAKEAILAALAERARGGPLPPPRAIEVASEPSGMPCARVAHEAFPVAGFAPGERLPLTVSISHAGGCALAAAAWSERPGARLSLGVDLEIVEPRSPWFAGTFFTRDEQRYAQASAAERALRAALVWSAKEAVLKALGVGLTVDTADVCCLPGAALADPSEWPLAPAGGDWQTFTAECAPALSPRAGTVRGIWRSFPGCVAALAAATIGREPMAAARAD